MGGWYCVERHVG
ncbi:MAG: hypothetical protein EZS28_012264, partial [Streblomastix strix]